MLTLALFYHSWWVFIIPAITFNFLIAILWIGSHRDDRWYLVAFHLAATFIADWIIAGIIFLIILSIIPKKECGRP